MLKNCVDYAHNQSNYAPIMLIYYSLLKKNVCRTLYIEVNFIFRLLW